MKADLPETRGGFLFKTEPEAYSFERLQREGHAVWDGVTNPLALRHLGSVTKGDPVLVYHTGSVRAVVGLARAASSPYPDPGAKDPRQVVVDLEPLRALPRPVLLGEIKADARFASLPLVRMGRLSVMPVPADLFRAILALAGDRG